MADLYAKVIFSDATSGNYDEFLNMTETFFSSAISIGLFEYNPSHSEIIASVGGPDAIRWLNNVIDEFELVAPLTNEKTEETKESSKCVTKDDVHP